MTHSKYAGMSPVRFLAVIGVISVIAGALTGYGLGVTARYQAPQIREFYLFNGSLPFNETVFGIPHDTFTPDRIIVNRGDTVLIHYVNVEDIPERHSFTMDRTPYSFNYVLYRGPRVTVQNATVSNQQNVILSQGENVTITFRADLPGVFQYYCIFHLPTMTGYISVIG